MKGFEKSKWKEEFRDTRIDLRVFHHIKLPFIRVYCMKEGKSRKPYGLDPGQSPTWKFTLRTKNSKHEKERQTTRKYNIKKFSTSYIEKYFDDIMNDNSSKYIIFNNLFES